jgi:hypothetical protein
MVSSLSQNLSQSLSQNLSQRVPMGGPSGSAQGLKNLRSIQKTLQGLKMLIRQHLSSAVLCDRLENLPHQFQSPCPRPWRPIDWKGINASQIIGIDPLIFIAILAGSADTEDPIRGYTQASRQYLQELHPEMAKFVGGVADTQGNLIELGLWEKEERQHSPALQKLYTQLTGLKLRLVDYEPRSYQPTEDPEIDLYHHGLHRIATEYGATCLYLWLAAHTVGPLRAVLEELLIDEINHMTKFWGYGLWAYPETSGFKIVQTLVCKALKKVWSRDSSSPLHTLRRMAQVLHWESWSFSNKLTFVWTFAIALIQMNTWSRNLTPAYLQKLFG